MGPRVDEVMSRGGLFSLRPTDDVETATRHLLALGISGAPVVDFQGRLLGVISWRDLAARKTGRTVAARMTSPAITARASEPVEEAARRLCEEDLHRVPVVDDDGRAIGMLSAVDALKAILGVPVAPLPKAPLDRAPARFPH